MANLATVLKEEIRRLARKEVNAQTEVLRRNSAQHRRDIATLKRKVSSLEKKVALLEKKTWREATASPGKETAESARFSAKGLASQRKRLKLSVADYAKLAGVSVPTLYNWESGKTRPRKEQLARLIALRGISKREAIARLEVL